MSADPSCSYVLGDIATDAALLDNIKTEDQVDPSDITTPCQVNNHVHFYTVYNYFVG